VTEHYPTKLPKKFHVALHLPKYSEKTLLTVKPHIRLLNASYFMTSIKP